MSPPADRRLDDAIVAAGLADTIDRARALIAAGLVAVGDASGRSADQRLENGVSVRLRGAPHPWASRGGLKLVAALDAFGVGVEGRVCLDAGASTGGFVDVLLARGAAQIYAVDVGYGQLLTRIARDERVVILDRTNIRLLTSLPGEQPSLVTLDLSFISLRAVLPNLALLAPRADVVVLFKPQFEVGREAVGPGGVVTDAAVVLDTINSFVAWVTTTLPATCLGPAIESPICGAKGNHEWLIHLRLPGERM